MIRRPPRSTRTDTLFPYTPLFRSGSTGEAAALFNTEYDALLRAAVEELGGHLPVVAGTGLSNTTMTIEQTRRAAALGADAALVVTPPYRSEERRVGTECVSTCRARWSPYHSTQKT